MPSKRSPSSSAADMSGRQTPPLARPELFATVFLTGAAVMVLEILGTRIISPVFGASLFVWAALLAVTLGSLACGYWAGGVLVDRQPTPRLLGLTVLVAGLLLALVPPIARVVLGATGNVGPRLGPLLAAALIFTPCLLVLGMVGPVAVRLASNEVIGSGKRVGGIYAVSTVGSLVGTLLTAFVLIPAFDTNRIVGGAGVVLVLAGAIPLMLRRRPAALLALLVPMLGFATPNEPSLPKGITIVARSQSPYSLVEVIDDSERGVRFLRADHSVIGAQFKSDRSAGFAFLHLLESVRFIRPEARHMLQIGLGIGSLPEALETYGITTDVVEIDPDVVRFAREHFGFSPTGEVHVEDARTFVQRTDQRYDVIVHDTFTGGATPEHLLSVEILTRIRDRLQPGGLLALNFLGYPDGPAAQALMRTIHAVFPNVRAFRDGVADPHQLIANVVFFASDAGLDFTVPPQARFENDLCERIARAFPAWEVLKTVPVGSLITDAWNPMARLQLPIAEEHFRAMNQLLPAEVWLH